MKIKNFLQILSLALPLVISACGGGGGGTAGSTTGDANADDTNDNASSENTAPVANNDTAPSITQGGSITVTASQGVLANDTDADNDPLTAQLISGSDNGTVVLNSNGSFVYTHNGSNNASDSFTYVANDGTENSNIATVSLNIALPPPNNAPVASNDNVSGIAQGDSITVTSAQGVLANDTDADSDPLTAQLISGPSNGTVTLEADGSFTYTHDNSSNGSDSFTYVANDGIADSNIATVNLSIDLNTPPIAALFCDNTDQAISFVGDLNSVVSDSDGDTLSFTQLTSPANGTVDSFDVTGTFTYTPDSDFRGIDSFTYEVDDLRGGVATETIQIIVGKTRIMPLGDSITRGVGSRIDPEDTPDPFDTEQVRVPETEFEVGYRQFLAESLANNGFAVDFVGNESETVIADFFENQHEGHPSINADEILNGAQRSTTNNDIFFFPPNPDIATQGITRALELNPADIILLHIGTNDISGGNGDSPEIVALDVNGILDAIDNVDPNITVILARIVFSRDPIPNNGDIPEDDDPLRFNSVIETNNAVVAMAQERITNGDDIIIVDMQSRVDVITMIHDDSSGAHPTPEGYQVMADIWLHPLTGTLGIPTDTDVASNIGAFDGNALLDRCPVI